MLDVRVAENLKKIQLEEEGMRYYASNDDAPTLYQIFAGSNLDLRKLGSGSSPFASNDKILSTPIKAMLISTDSLK